MATSRRIRTMKDIETIPSRLVISKWTHSPDNLPTLVREYQFKHLIIYGGPSTHKLSSQEREERENEWRNGVDLSCLSSIHNLESFRFVQMHEIDSELDISPLTECPNLSTIEFNSDLPSVDMTPLKDMEAITSLRFDFISKTRYITISGDVTREGRDAFRPDLGVVAQCEHLTDFAMSSLYDRLDLSPLGTHEKLERVEVGCKEFLDLSPLGGCPSLKILTARQPWLLGVKLPSSESLEVLDLSDGELATPFGRFMSRGARTMKHTEVLDLSQLLGSDNLHLVDLKRNDLYMLELYFLREWTSDKTPIIDARENPLVCVDKSPLSAGDTLLMDPHVKRVSTREEVLHLIREEDSRIGFL